MSVSFKCSSIPTAFRSPHRAERLPGQRERNEFGGRTEAALIRFQQANALAINLVKSTGLFGEATRSYVNGLLGTQTADACASTSSSKTANTPSSSSALPFTRNLSIKRVRRRCPPAAELPQCEWVPRDHIRGRLHRQRNDDVWHGHLPRPRQIPIGPRSPRQRLLRPPDQKAHRWHGNVNSSVARAHSGRANHAHRHHRLTSSQTPTASPRPPPAPS